MKKKYIKAITKSLLDEYMKSDSNKEKTILNYIKSGKGLPKYEDRNKFTDADLGICKMDTF